jgi:uncharacterized protein YjiS (DUF1127 family)
MSIEHAGLNGHAPNLLQKAEGLAANSRNALRRYLAVRDAERRLSAYSDDMLDDIGLNRSDIATAVRGLPPERDDRPIPYWSR